MSKVIVSVQGIKNSEESACSLRTASFNIADAGLISIVSLDGVENLTGTRNVGEALAATLRENPTLAAALDHALAHPDAPPSLPIYFLVGDRRAHSLAWEALVGNNNFLALDERWPIARIASGGLVRQEGAQRAFSPPLKLVCVLSAVEAPAIDEWNEIYSAVQNARTNGLPIEVMVYAGEEELIDVIDKLDDVRVAPVPKLASDLIIQVEEQQPHVVHFYCHGTVTESGIRRLYLGTITDFDSGQSSVRVNIEDLAVAIARAGTWVVVLNACQSAQASGDALTHAEEAVNRGVPVAVGMRRQVDAADAHAFSGAFYPALFQATSSALQMGGTCPIAWADTLLGVRQRIRDLHDSDPDQFDEWTLPVLYTGPGSFELVVSAPGASPEDTTRTLGEAKTVAGMVEILPDDAPASLVEDLRRITPPEGN